MNTMSSQLYFDVKAIPRPRYSAVEQRKSTGATYTQIG